MPGAPLLKLLSMRETSSGGAGAPPPPIEARLDVSYFSKSGDSSMSHDIVGTPTNCVMRSRSISSRARSGTHLYMITSLKPPRKQLIMTGISPVTWKSGTQRMNAVA